MAPSPDSGNSSAQKIGNGCLAILAGFVTTLGCTLILAKVVLPSGPSAHLPPVAWRALVALFALATFGLGGVATGLVAKRHKVLTAGITAAGIIAFISLAEAFQGHRLALFPMVIVAVLECLGGWTATLLPSTKTPAVDAASSSSGSPPPISSPD